MPHAEAVYNPNAGNLENHEGKSNEPNKIANQMQSLSAMLSMSHANYSHLLLKCTLIDDTHHRYRFL